MKDLGSKHIRNKLKSAHTIIDNLFIHTELLNKQLSKVTKDLDYWDVESLKVIRQLIIEIRNTLIEYEKYHIQIYPSHGVDLDKMIAGVSTATSCSPIERSKKLVNALQDIGY